MLEAGVTVRRGDFTLTASIRAGEGEVVAVAGPNGAGKTSLLRALAGLDPVAAGEVRIGGRVVDAPPVTVAAHARQVGYVPQRDHLFPHLSALDNVAFGLRSRGVRRHRAREEAARWLGELQAGDLAGRRPHELSGGQSKRVAVARALAVEPKLVLLDEPTAGVDAVASLDVRRAVRAYLAGGHAACVLVTHDAVEAMSIASHIAVLEDGRVTQEGTPDELRLRPRSPYVAALVGVNLIRGTFAGGRLRTPTGAEVVCADAAPPGDARLTIHPRAVALHRDRPHGSPRNVWPGVVRDVEVAGERVRVRLDGPLPLVAEITASAAAALGVRPGAEVYASVKATEIGLHPD